MSKATADKLHRLHGMLADSFTQRLEEDVKDKIPTDAATLGAISKFLKDNNITADPASDNKLGDLQEKFKNAVSPGRRERASNVVELARQDLKTGS